MKETITFKLSKSVGYRGKGSAKTWIAEITGTDDQFIFQRSFIETEATDRQEMFRVRRKGKGSWEEAAACPVGLYEINAGADDRRYRMVWLKQDGTATYTKIDADRATRIAMLMDEGQTFEEARVATKPPAAEVKP
jgi:(2Fe-2S) ferredoxin